MKNHIREIAEQAMQWALNESNSNDAKFKDLRDLKFAELVVNECINEITKHYEKEFKNAVEPWDFGYLGGLRTAIDLIKIPNNKNN
jgi:hypothetical protein